MNDEDELRTTLQAMLGSSFSNVSVNDFGSVMISLPDNPVACKVNRLRDGSLVVNIESPVLLDVPSPRPDVYELICLLTHQIPFGSLSVIGGSTGDIHIFVRGQLFANGFSNSHLTRAVSLTRDAAIAQIQALRQLAPPIGGVTAYGAM